jgi:HSP20 family molecular chaperone IbpA
MGAALVTTTSLLGWQLWSSHQLHQDVKVLQQALSQQSQRAPSANGNPLALKQNPSVASVPNARLNTGPNAAPNVTPPQTAPQSAPVNPPGAATDPFASFFGGNGDPFAGFFSGGDPFGDFDQMRQEMEQHMQQFMSATGATGAPWATNGQGGSLFDAFGNFGGVLGGTAQPAISMQEKSDAYIITIDLPKGSSDVEVNTAVANGQLNIEGKLTVKHSDQQQGRNFTSMQTQQFSRSLALPADADPLGIRNETRGDQMIVTLPKQTG